MTFYTRCFGEGWLVQSEDDGRLRIARLDDPPSARPLKCECDNTHENNQTCCRYCWKAGFRSTAPSEAVFESDYEALWHVMEMATRGSKFHRQVILKLATQKQPKKIKSK